MIIYSFGAIAFSSGLFVLYRNARAPLGLEFLQLGDRECTQVAITSHFKPSNPQTLKPSNPQTPILHARPSTLAHHVTPDRFLTEIDFRSVAISH